MVLPAITKNETRLPTSEVHLVRSLGDEAKSRRCCCLVAIQAERDSDDVGRVWFENHSSRSRVKTPVILPLYSPRSQIQTRAQPGEGLSFSFRRCVCSFRLKASLEHDSPVKSVPNLVHMTEQEPDQDKTTGNSEQPRK
jgi:hypothetical protein